MAINKNLPETHIILADAYDAIDEIENSRNEAKIALSPDPDSSAALGCYGTYLVKDNKIDEGINLLEKAELIDNNLFFIHCNLVTAYYKKNNKNRMINEFKRLYKLNPTARLRVEIIITYLDKIKFTKIIGGLFMISVFGFLVSRIWNLLWIAAFCFLILLTSGLVVRKLWPSQK